MLPPRPIAVHLVGGTPDDLAVALSAQPEIRRVPEKEAEVWLVGAQQVLPSWPAEVAVLAVGEGAERWGLAPPDLALSREELQADPAGALRRARALRCALRPMPGDAREDWLEGVRQLLGADLAAWHDRAGTTAVGAAEGIDLEAAAAGAPWLAVGPEARTRLKASSGVEGAAAMPVEAGERGVLVVAVRQEGQDFARRCPALLRQLALTASRQGLVAELESSRSRARWLEGLLRGALSIASHDLRNAQFGLQIGVRLLGRYPEAAQTVSNLRGSVEEPLKTVQRMVGGARELLDGPPPSGPGPTPLRETWARVLEQAASKPTGKSPANPVLDEGAPDVSLAVGGGTFEALAATLLRNALPHGPAQVRWQTDEREVRMTVRNPGTLPFRDLARLVPFEHRSPSGSGLGLCVARGAAAAAGVGLTLQQQGEEVVAELILPRAR